MRSAMQSGIGLQGVTNMPKYIVSFEEYAFYSIPVEAPNQDEAIKKAQDKVCETPEADYRDITLADVDDFPNVEEVEDACFERFGGVAA
jgi:hypothetical protein